VNFSLEDELSYPKILRKLFYSLNLKEVCTLCFLFVIVFFCFLQALQNIGAILRGAGLDYSSGN